MVGRRCTCVEVDWPAAYTWSALQYRRGYSGPSAWMGRLIFENSDASGLYYRRNRYYDSEKGRFTQEDPIGLAGGLNAYGFGNGDPISSSYSDPFGSLPTIAAPIVRMVDHPLANSQAATSQPIRGATKPVPLNP
jgi:RHS repeat-associated protein